MFKLNNFKYLVIGIIIGGLLSVPMVQAANTVKLVVNGEDITYKSDVPPQIIDGRTLVPARALAEALGASVEWDGISRAVVVTYNNRMVTKQDIEIIPINIIVDGVDVTSRVIDLSSSELPAVINGRIMMPVRPLSLALGAYAQYDPDSKTLSFTKRAIDFNHEN